MTLPCDDSAFFSKPSRAALALSVIGVTWSSASRITRSAWSAISRCLEHHEGTRLKCREHGLTVARRYTPLCLAPVVEGGNLRSRLPSARQCFVEKPDRRAILVCGQDLEAPQGMPAPGPVADRLETARRLVVGVAASARLAGLQWRGCLVVDVLAVLNASPGRIRPNLSEALHLGRGVGRINEASPFEDGLESGHGTFGGRDLGARFVSGSALPSSLRTAWGAGFCQKSRVVRSSRPDIENEFRAGRTRRFSDRRICARWHL